MEHYMEEVGVAQKENARIQNLSANGVEKKFQNAQNRKYDRLTKQDHGMTEKNKPEVSPMMATGQSSEK